MSAHRHRHRISFAQRARRRWPFIVVGFVLVGALAVAGVRIFGLPSFPGDFAAVLSGCTEPAPLVIVADPSIAPALKTVAAVFDDDTENCSTTEIRAQDSADTAALLASGAGGDVDAWVPDSRVWIDRMATTAVSLGRTAPEIDEGTSLASTPVVLAAPASRAAEFAAGPLGWSTLLGGTVGTLLPDPESSSASLAGLMVIKSVASQTDPRQFLGAMIEIGKVIPATPEAAFAAMLTVERLTIVVTTEQEVAAHNADAAQDPLVALYPVDGTLALTYPFVSMINGEPAEVSVGAAGSVEGSGGSPSPPASGTQELLADFASAVRADRATLAEAGFRDVDGGGKLSISGVLAEPTSATPALDGAVQLEILRAWGVLNLRSRLLVVIDVSGSMLEPASGGLRRIDVFQLAAGEALGKFSGEAELGVWVFSQNRVGTQDWEELAPIAALADPAHLQQIGGIIGSLPDRAFGYTGLYDTILAGVNRVREGHDPAKVNAVLLITDGKNEDDNGIDLPTLLANLAAGDDPLKPVQVILIGFGPDTDIASMTQIAQATGGGAYSATVPEDLGKVLVDALSQRGCRPNC